MQRTTVGILSLALLVCGIAFLLNSSQYGLAWDVDFDLMSGILIRTGLVLGAIWLAMPQVKRLVSGMSPFGVVCALIAIVLFAWRPRLLLYFLPVLLLLGLLHIAGWFTKPKQQSRAASRSPSRRG